jgi:enamine deaminase RidA (YjgF/YER057c/UK114 family)
MFAPPLAAAVNARLSPAAAGLADGFYAALDTGSFTGLPTVRWNAMDDFRFIADPAAPFAYTTGRGRRIEPRLMETDGGSIPRILRGFKKLSPWGYAPAFIIHDWIFTAHQCGLEPDNDLAFSDSARILAEAMKTLMEAGYRNFDGRLAKLEKSAAALYLIYLAVDSFIARKRWNHPKSVICYPRAESLPPPSNKPAVRPKLARAAMTRR